jgi:hypothetical protein
MWQFPGGRERGELCSLNIEQPSTHATDGVIMTLAGRFNP